MADDTTLFLKYKPEKKNSYEYNWRIWQPFIPQKYFENIGENILIFNMNLFSFNSLDNKLAKHILAFYKEPLKIFLICGGEKRKSTKY